MIPRFQLAQLNSRVRWGHWEGARFWRGQDHESESGNVESEELLRHARGGIKWAVGSIGGGRCKPVSHHTAELREIMWGESVRREQEEAWG